MTLPDGKGRTESPALGDPLEACPVSIWVTEGMGEVGI